MADYNDNNVLIKLWRNRDWNSMSVNMMALLTVSLLCNAIWYIKFYSTEYSRKSSYSENIIFFVWKF